ncbi:MAG: [acyl-carrier-protein] S-malonyltransferase [Clostridia bacterium]|nr:[acyl-carrier-protein] S-malonyltransferase [Clostridia bacterium]NLS85578.1 ACP S-malonyltransferase [Oscillospiraceae bacterium]
MKLAFLYAGQGSQKVGMGRDFYNEEPIFSEIFDFLPPNLRALCFEGSAEELGETQNTQPALLAFAAGVTALLKQNGITPDIAAGLSLGEYSALTAAGVWDAETAISLVRFRGEQMALATKGRACKMAAAIGMPRDALAACCAEASKKGVAEIANYNCPNQLVIGGDADAVDDACGLALAAGARRCLPLAVSGAFHTSLMRPAANALEQKFKTLTFGKMRFPVVFNCTANELKAGENVPSLLVRQVQSGVYFEDTLRYIAAQGVDTVIEIGAGRVLSGFVKKTVPELKCFAIETHDDFKTVLAAIKKEKK